MKLAENDNKPQTPNVVDKSNLDIYREALDIIAISESLGVNDLSSLVESSIVMESVDNIQNKK